MPSMNAPPISHDAGSRLADSTAVPRPLPLPLRLQGGQRPLSAGPGATASPGGALDVWADLLGGQVLDPAELRTLAELASVRQVLQGETVLSRSVHALALVALQGGEVALGLRTQDGIFRIERIVRGPAWLDLSSAWLGLPHGMDAQALGPATLVEWPQDAMARRLPHCPGLALRLIRSLAREAHALAMNTHELMHKDAPARLAHWLRQRCEPLPGQAGQASVTLRDRKRDLASQLSITPETLSRLMRSFSSQGVIEVAGYRVRVLDLAALERLAQDG